MKIVSEEDMRQQVGNTCAFDLVDFDAISGYKIKNDSPFKTVKEEVAYSTGIPIERQRYWTFARRENQTIRPSEMLTCEISLFLSFRNDMDGSLAARLFIAGSEMKWRLCGILRRILRRRTLCIHRK